MDLYDPLYAPRPTVEPELFASLRPQTYEGKMGDAKPEPAKQNGARRPVSAEALTELGAVVTPARQPAEGMGFGGFGGSVRSLTLHEGISKEDAEELKRRLEL